MNTVFHAQSCPTHNAPSQPAFFRITNVCGRFMRKRDGF